MEEKIKLLRIDLEKMIESGAKSWFEIGLQYLPVWHQDYYEVKIANQAKWSESKKRYGIK
jgi:hypothetical protein